MIASHNSFTFLEPTKWWLKPFAFLWKCQDKTLEQQYKAGVRYFDVRVFLNKEGEWQICHGVAEFSVSFTTILALCLYLENRYPHALYRIILEKGDDAAEKLFKGKSYICVGKHRPKLVFVAIKRDWQVLYDNQHFKRTEDYTAKLWYPSRSLWWNIKNFFKVRSIKSWARRNNPLITQEMIDDPETLYFYDYV